MLYKILHHSAVMKLRYCKCLYLLLLVFVSSCGTTNIGLYNLKNYNQPKIISIEMKSGEIIEHAGDDILMSKLDKEVFILHLKDGSTVQYNTDEIRRMEIQDRDPDRRESLTLSVTMITVFSAILVVLTYGFLSLKWY